LTNNTIGCSINYQGKEKETEMTAIKSITFIAGWIITASIGLWAMALYGAVIAVGIGRTL